MYSGRFKPKPVENEYGVFDSKSEYERYLLLLDMERNGLITDLKRQVTYELLPKQTKVVRKELKTKVKEVVKVVERPMQYTCDFTYYDKDGEFIAEEHKGSKWNVDEAVRIKKKLLYYFHGIELKFSFPPKKEKKKKAAK